MTLDNSTAQLILDAKASGTPLYNITEPFPQNVDNSFLIKIVQDLHSLYFFKNFVFYITERIDLKAKSTSEFFDNFWSNFPTAPNTILRHSYNATCTMAEFISTPSLVLVVTTERDDPIMELAAQGLQGVRWLKTIFILLPILTTDEFYVDFETFTKFGNIIKSTYDWIWNKQFLNTAMITIHDNVYIQEPYPTPVIINKTGNWMPMDFFRRYNDNMKGYAISTPILYDLPRVFKTDRKRNQYEDNYIRGSSANLFLSFLNFVNATLNDTSSAFPSKFNLEYFLDLVNKNVFEILIHSFTAMIEYEVGKSYPIGINDWCFMVPYRNRSPEHLYLPETLQHSTWLLVCFSAFYISVALWFCSPLRPREFSAAFLQAISTLIYGVPTKIMKTTKMRMRYLFVLLFLLGFFTSNMYTSKMTSFLTTSPSQSQINTVEDVINANLRIMVMNFEYDIMKKLPKQYPPRFLEQLDIVEKSDLDIYRDPMNGSFGYSVTTDRWQFINKQQQHLDKPVFRLTDICSGPFYHVYPVHIDSHLRSPLQAFIMISKQSGFMHAWETEAFWEAVHLKRMHMIIVNEQPVPLSLNFFSGVWYVWCFGLVLAGMASIVEIKWFEYKRRSRSIRRRRKPKTFLRRFINS